MLNVTLIIFKQKKIIFCFRPQDASKEVVGIPGSNPGVGVPGSTGHKMGGEPGVGVRGASGAIEVNR